MATTNGTIVALDTETTGLRTKESRVIEIGLCAFTDGVLVREWSAIIVPSGFTIPQASINIHHITNEIANRDGIPIARALDQVADILRGATIGAATNGSTTIGAATNGSTTIGAARLLVGHNLKFDVAMLSAEAGRIDHPLAAIMCAISQFDTCDCGRDIWGRRATLDALYLRVTGNPMGTHHRALADAHATYEIYVGLRARLGAVRETLWTLPEPSEEQARAISEFRAGNNILVDSVAGGGKTTFILHLARAIGDMPILVLTYNRKLRDETFARAASAGLCTTDVYTYHGFCGRYFARTCCDDRALAKCAREVIQTEYRALIVDESQDVTPLYYKLIRNIIAHNSAGIPRIVIIGDKYQSIYAFAGADARFLTMARELYEMPFAQCDFSTTYRCTIPMARFVNALIGHERIRAIRDGARVGHMIANIFSMEIPTLIENRIRQYGATRVLILVPSFRAKPYAGIANALSARNIDIYASGSDTQEPVREAMNGKLVMLTYHQSKGIERDCVFVLGFDASYFVYYCKDAPSTVLCNAQYVALTRARKELIVVQNCACANLSFATTALAQCARIGARNLRPRAMPHIDSKLGITRFVTYKSRDTIARVWKLIKPMRIQKARDVIDVPIVARGRNGCVEEVSDITGTALPLLYGKQCGCANVLCGNESTLDDRLARMMREYRNFYCPQCTTLRDTLRTAALLNAYASHYEHKLRQIASWDWLTDNMANRALARMTTVLGEGNKGVEQEKVIFGEYGGLQLVGIIDWYDARAARPICYEIKCVRKLRDEHFLQLACYAYILSEAGICADYRLFNVFSGKLYSITANQRNLKRVMALLARDQSVGNLEDALFVDYAREIAR
jgi:DNA polymerase III epsilon subunit-like protein